MRAPARIAAITIALLVAGAAPASAQWQAEEMPGTAGSLPPRSLAFDREGRALALFEATPADRSSPRFTGLALRATDGVWSSPAPVAEIGWGGAQAFTYARTRVLLVTLQVTGYGRYHRARFRLVWAPGSTSGAFGAYRQIASSAAFPAAAVNPAGDALVAFMPQGKSGIWVAERRAGGGFRAPRRFSAAGAFPVVALNARGDRVVAWRDRGGVRVRIARAGDAWGPVETVSRDRFADGFRALVTENGRAVVTWASMTAFEEQPIGIDAGVAVHPRGGRWSTRTLEHANLAPHTPSADASAIPLVDSSGHLLVAYTAKHGAGTGVELASISASGRVTAVTVVSGDSTAASLDDAAAGAAGRLAVTWAEHDAIGGVRTFVALRPGPGPFSAPAQLTPPGQIGLAASRVAFSPLTGQALVVRGYVAGGRGALAAAATQLTTQAKEP